MAKRSESRIKITSIGVRVKPEEKERFQKRAAAFGISAAELCRQLILNSTPKSKADQDAIVELAVTRADLGRLGGLLKGWLSGTFPQGSPNLQTHADVVKLLREIEDAQKKVVQAVKNLTGKS